MTAAPIRAVFFDFAGTLFSDRALRDAHLHQLRFVADAIGVTATDGRLREAYRHGMGVAYRLVARQPFYIHRDLFGAAFAAMAEYLGGSLDEAVVRATVDRQYQATVEWAQLRPDALDTLAALRERGMHMQVVSNIDDEQLNGLLDRLTLRPVLDAATSSEEARSCKPDPAIYQVALDKAACAPGAVLFVGDSIAHDVAGPAAVGMRTAWLNPDAKPLANAANRPDYVIERLGQVPELLSWELVR